jgi:hypothetical protein
MVIDPSARAIDASCGRSPLGVANRIRRPSGDHDNVSSTTAGPTSRGAPPSALITQIPRCPPRSDTKAIC